MITTEDCKKAIVDRLNADDGLEVISMAYSETKDIDSFLRDVYIHGVTTNTAEIVLQNVRSPKNWSRMGKRRYGEETERVFNCKPFDDQLRAYTYDDGTKITRIYFAGE